MYGSSSRGGKRKKGITWCDAYGDAKTMQRMAAEAKVREAKEELSNATEGRPGPNALEHLLTHLPVHPDC